MARSILDRVRKSRLAFRLNQRRLRAEAGRGAAGGALRSVPSGDRLVALSYDDGPSPANTPELLEILASAGAHATFFVVGSVVAREADLAARVVAAGHELGSHSYSHKSLRALNETDARSEMELGQRAVAEIAGASTLFRPPFGKRAKGEARLCEELGLTSVLWSVDSGDTMPFSAARIAREVIDRVEPGDIVLMHDGGDRRQGTLDATRQILAELGGRGYRFVTVSELIASSAPSSGSSHTSRHHG